MRQFWSAAATKARLIACGIAGCAALADAQSLTAVEFHHSAFDHYFITAFPDEIAALDAGAFDGTWKRTGRAFDIWGEPVAGTSPACRFFSASFAPKSSHFYTAIDTECAKVRADGTWQYEGVAFHLKPLESVGGTCPSGSVALYRLYNDGMGGAPNHRYATSTSVVDQMRGGGWVLEGSRLTGAFACTPRPTITNAQGIWSGTLVWSDAIELENSASSISMIVLESETYYAIYSYPGGSGVAGVVIGDGRRVADRFTSAGALNVEFGYRANSATINAGISSDRVMSATIASAVPASTQYGTVFALYDSGAVQGGRLASVAGTFTGSFGSAAGWRAASVSLIDTGVLSGASDDCSFSGIASPREGLDVFDLTISFAGPSCPFDADVHFGLVRYDAGKRQMYAVGANPSHTDAFLFVGQKTR